MASAPLRAQPHMSVELFRGFREGRPDEERWELINGVAVMMTPPTYTHQQIATNLQFLLYSSLRAHAPGLAVYQTGGVNIGPAVEHYDPEPDVLVVDAGLSEELDRHYADRFYLAAEVVSASDRTFVESKREVYKLHEACTCILTIWQDRQEVRVDLRTDGGWQEHVLTKPDDELVLADFGLRCKVSDVYEATPLQPRSVKPR